MARLETSSCDDKKRIALFVSPQAVDGANCPLRTAIGGLLAIGAVGDVADADGGRGECATTW